MVAKGYLTKLMGNTAVKSYVGKHAPEILEQFELVVNTLSMEESLQNQDAIPSLEEAGFDTAPEPTAMAILPDVGEKPLA